MIIADEHTNTQTRERKVILVPAGRVRSAHLAGKNVLMALYLLPVGALDPSRHQRVGIVEQFYF